MIVLRITWSLTISAVVQVPTIESPLGVVAYFSGGSFSCVTWAPSGTPQAASAETVPAAKATAATDNTIERYITNSPFVEAPPAGALPANGACARHSGGKASPLAFR